MRDEEYQELCDRLTQEHRELLRQLGYPVPPDGSGTVPARVEREGEAGERQWAVEREGEGGGETVGGGEGGRARERVYCGGAKASEGAMLIIIQH